MILLALLLLWILCSVVLSFNKMSMGEVAPNFYLRKVYRNICTLNFFNIYQSTNGFLRNHHYFRVQVYRNGFSLLKTTLFVVDGSLRWQYNSKIDCTHGQTASEIMKDSTWSPILYNKSMVSNRFTVFPTFPKYLQLNIQKCLIWFCQGKLK